MPQLLTPESSGKCVCLVFESGAKRGAWKGERVAELIEALNSSGFKVFFIGLRGLKEIPLRIRKERVCLLFALPGQLARVATLFKQPGRKVRTAISQIVFAEITRPFSRRVVLTQTTLGRLVEKLKARGHIVWAECDMTDPKAWRDILLAEGIRIGATAEMESELPPIDREREEQRSFASADKILVFSSWAFKNLPDSVQEKSVVVPPVSVPPADRIIASENKEAPVEFIFVGQIGFRKGIHILMQAMQDTQLESMKCHVFGGLRDNFRQYMNRCDLSFPPSMRVYGQVDWRSFVTANPKRYVAVLPSLVEGTPRFIFEAATMGIPSIVSPAALPAIFNHEKETLAIAEVAPDDLRRALARFFEEPRLWEMLSANTYQTYIQGYEASYGRRIASLLSGNNGVVKQS